MPDHPHILKLYVGKIFTGVTVEPDPQWASMWRIHKDGKQSDMVNLSRAKDAALTWADIRPGGHTEVYWRARQDRQGVR